MPTPLLKDIENSLLSGETKMALEDLLEWVRAHLPEKENEVMSTLGRFNKAVRDRNRNDITEDFYQTEYTKIILVTQDVLSICRHSGAPSEGGAVLHLHHKHTCDRVPQNDDYQKFSLEASAGKARFYYLYGDEQQSHEGFFRRICYELEGRLFDYLHTGIQASCKVVTAELTFDFSQDPTIYRMNVLKSLLAGLGVPVNELEPLLERNLLYLYEKSPLLRDLGPKDFVCVLIQIGQWDWHPQLTPEAAKWFIYEFCKCEIPAESPRFLFFLGVEFDGTDDTVRKEVQAAVAAGQELKPLPELGMVQLNDVGRWLGKYKILAQTSTEQRHLLQEHFADNREFYMEEVELRLEKIITEFNNRHTR